MDGYAVCAADAQGRYEVIEDIPAGTFPKKVLTPGKVSKIMTGAPLPGGATAVIPVEKTCGFVEVGQEAEIKHGVIEGANIAKQGGDYRRGSLIIEKGRVVTTALGAIMAGIGADPVTVYKKPTVAILTTGDELVAPAEKPKPGQIRNSNYYNLSFALESMGIKAVNLGNAGDEGADLRTKIAEGSRYDLLLVSGGVSAGEKDLVPKLLTEQGYEKLFHKIKIKPGKPTWFGAMESGGRKRYVFGMPGNPVSTFIIFRLLVAPAIRKLSGASDIDTPALNATLIDSFRRKDTEREEYVPVILEWNSATYSPHPAGFLISTDGLNNANGYIARSIRYQGSGHIGAYAEATALMKIDIGVEYIEPGTVVDVLPLK
jgi:molybdopterin molybdotransferase